MFSIHYSGVDTIIYKKLLVYDTEGNFAGINWKKWFNNIIDPNKNIITDRERIKNNHIYIFMKRFSEYLFEEFNLFYQ